MSTELVAKVLDIPTVQPQLDLVPRELEPAIIKIIARSQRWQQATYEFTKRALDIIVSITALVVGSPIFLLVAIAIKGTSRGPVFFVHLRLARDGKQFRCYKFRTMVHNAEQRLHDSPELRKQFEVNFKLHSDPRVTPLGGWLRRLSIDELPQFWNVLKGDMSLIGPRPIVLKELAFYGRHASKLLSVKPGMSGLWQTCGRSDTSYDARVKMDILYVETTSIFLDLTLLLRTVPIVFNRAGAC